MERYLQENFELPSKNPSEEAQRRWRSAVGTLVKNRRRRFRHVPDLDQRHQDHAKRRSVQVPTHPIPYPSMNPNPNPIQSNPNPRDSSVCGGALRVVFLQALSPSRSHLLHSPQDLLSLPHNLPFPTISPKNSCGFSGRLLVLIFELHVFVVLYCH